MIQYPILISLPNAISGSSQSSAGNFAVATYNVLDKSAVCYFSVTLH